MVALLFGKNQVLRVPIRVGTFHAEHTERVRAGCVRVQHVEGRASRKVS